MRGETIPDIWWNPVFFVFIYLYIFLLTCCTLGYLLNCVKFERKNWHKSCLLFELVYPCFYYALEYCFSPAWMYCPICSRSIKIPVQSQDSLLSLSTISSDGQVNNHGIVVCENYSSCFRSFIFKWSKKLSGIDGKVTNFRLSKPYTTDGELL